MDTGSVIHHPRPRSGVDVDAGVDGLVGFYDVPRDAYGDDIAKDSTEVKVQRVREIALALMETLRQKEKEATTPHHHTYLFRDEDGDGESSMEDPNIVNLPLPPSHAPNNRS